MNESTVSSPLELRRARARLERKLVRTREELQGSLKRLAEASGDVASDAAAQIGKQRWRGRGLYRKRSFLRRHPVAVSVVVVCTVGAALWACASATRAAE